MSAALLMLALGAVCGLLLSLASKKFHVEPDHRAEEILAHLPGYNCGGCGHAGCSAMAEALAAGEADVSDCRPSKQDQKDAIKAILSAGEN